MRRILAVVLPRIRLELAREADASLTKKGGTKKEPAKKEGAKGEGAEGDGVLAIVVARPGGAVKDERSLLGNTRLDEVSPEAHAMGVRPGHTIAAARARAASLSVRVVHEGAVFAALARLAEALLAFGATTSLSVQDDCVWVDVSGCAHLHGGEEALAATLGSRVHSLGHACRVGVADGPRIAAQIAWFSRENVTIALPGKGAEAIARLPVSSLPIDGDTLQWLKSSGLRQVGDVQALPRAAIGARLGPNAAEVLALLAGDDRAPLTPYVPPEVPEESLEMEYGVTSTEALVFVAKRLATMLAARLEGRGVGATRIDLVLKLDRALAVMSQSTESPRAARIVCAPDGRLSQIVSITLPTPLTLAAEILAVLRARLESFTVEAPVLGAALRAPELAPRGAHALDLFVPEARAERALPRLVAELVADLGPTSVGQLALTNRWSPLERAVLLPFGARPEKAPRLASLESQGIEPTRILPAKKPLSSSPHVTLTRRHEAIEWWKQGFTRTDYGYAWIEAASATAWVEVTAADDPTHPFSIALRGWVD